MASLMWVGCGGTDAPPPATEMDGGTDAGPLEPVIPMPDLWGSAMTLADENEAPNVVEVTLRARYETVTLGDGMTFEMMTYNGLAPGPVIQAKVGDEVIVHFYNELDQDTTVHWHGLRISDQMDGNPRIQDPVVAGGQFEYRFVVNEAGTYWYHPHVRAHIQIEHGLYGMLVVRDELDPAYDAERMVSLDDILLDEDMGMLYFPPHLGSMPERMHGRYGNVLLRNGKDIDVAERGAATRGDVERWRIVNTANARTMELSIRGARFRVISTDGGKLTTPYTTERLLLPVGQRYDVEVSYDDAGEAELVSHVMTVNAAGDVEEVEFTVLAVDVANSDQAAQEVPWPTVPRLIEERTASTEAELVFDVVSDPLRGVAWTINGESHPRDPIFTFRQGDTVHMLLRNDAGPEHPFHLHGQFFEIIPNGQPWTMQPGLKDTVLVPGFESVEVIAYMDNPGRWMAHCHILEHAELGFMAEIVVTPTGGSTLSGPAPHSGH